MNKGCMLHSNVSCSYIVHVSNMMNIISNMTNSDYKFIILVHKSTIQVTY